MNNVKIDGVIMKRISKWRKFSQLFSASIYVTVIPFLIIFLLHATSPTFEWCHTCMSSLAYTAVVVFLGKIVCGFFIRCDIWRWECERGGKLSNKEIERLL